MGFGSFLDEDLVFPGLDFEGNSCYNVSHSFRGGNTSAVMPSSRALKLQLLWPLTAVLAASFFIVQSSFGAGNSRSGSQDADSVIAANSNRKQIPNFSDDAKERANTTGTSVTAGATSTQATSANLAHAQTANALGNSPVANANLNSTSTIIDDGDNLNVPAGSTYIMTGTHTYNVGISVSGTILVGALTQGSSGYLVLSAPNIQIFSGGNIIADGAGYGSGQGPGAGATAVRDGTGGGGGFGGYGGFSPNGPQGLSYGSLTQPQSLGSGGAPGFFSGQAVVNGGAGGGQIQINGGVLNDDGQISANGNPGDFSSFEGRAGAGGSGGSIFINVTQLQGAGSVTVNGGAGVTNVGPISSGGGGRIATVFGSSTFSGVVTAYGGGGSRSGGPGTILWGNALIIDNNNVAGSSTTINSGTYAFDSITLNDALVSFGGGSNINTNSLTASNTSAFTVDALNFASGGAGLEQDT